MKCPECGSKNIKKEEMKAETIKIDPFIEYIYECECGCIWFDRNESGKGVL